MLEEEVIKTLRFLGIEKIEETLEVPLHPEFGDLASTVCFQLAKKEKRSPSEIAEELVKKIKIPKRSFIKKVEAKSGYINFFFNWEKISEKVLKEIQKGIKITEGKGKRVMVEHSQPNPVHPMHIGHARSTFLGDALANILEFLGYKVIRANYMNNVGLQVAKLVTAYLLWGEGKEPKGKPDFWLWEFYVKFHEEANKNPELEEKAREVLRKYEIEKDKEIIKIWNKIVDWCVKGFEETYKKLGIKFDVYFYESDSRELGKKIVDEAFKKGIAFKSSDGAIIADLEKYGLPNIVILRSDGTGLYITSDLGLTKQKFDNYKLDKSIWVVSSEQNLYFKQLFKILEILGFEWVKNCYHFSFELVRLPEGKMSSREGKAVMLDEVVKKLTELAFEEVEKRNPDLSEKEKSEIAEKIGVGALKYAIVKIDPNNTITFDWKRMLSLQGDTAPYLQYACTRCNGILRKAGKWKPKYKVKELKEEEKNLIKILFNFSKIVKNAAKEFKPNHICNYAFDLATAFDKFYEKCPVLRAEKDLMYFRLTLVDCTRKILTKCLELVGIRVPEKM
ncbi:MAG: arginine--tRNA ligase [Candidatus Aenigmarchaeota archaeon]|nr:arginine--tRNA ligase [Candidatus Aenigmarchaeota archaeon]